MNTQWYRLTKATLILVVVALAGYAIGDITYRMQQRNMSDSFSTPAAYTTILDQIDKDAFESGEAFTTTIFERISHSVVASVTPNDAFLHEVMAIPNNCIQATTSNELICYVLPGSVEQVRQEVVGEVEAHGWQQVTAQKSSHSEPLAPAAPLTFAKAEGEYRWMQVVLYPMGGATTCVFIPWSKVGHHD